MLVSGSLIVSVVFLPAFSASRSTSVGMFVYDGTPEPTARLSRGPGTECDEVVPVGFGPQVARDG